MWLDQMSENGQVLGLKLWWNTKEENTKGSLTTQRKQIIDK